MRLAAALGAVLALAGAGSTAATAPQVSTLHERRDALVRQLVKERAQHKADRRRLVRIIRHRTDVPEAIRLAAFTYGVDRWRMRRIAFCESRLDPGARNPSGASGLMQFMPSTWAGNRYGAAGFSVWSPLASALGAAYHASRYGWGAWECA